MPVQAHLPLKPGSPSSAQAPVKLFVSHAWSSPLPKPQGHMGPRPEPPSSSIHTGPTGPEHCFPQNLCGPHGSWWSECYMSSKPLQAVLGFVDMPVETYTQPACRGKDTKRGTWEILVFFSIFKLKFFSSFIILYFTFNTIIIIYTFFLFCHSVAYKAWFPRPGVGPKPLWWEHKIWATGLLENFGLQGIFIIVSSPRSSSWHQDLTPPSCPQAPKLDASSQTGTQPHPST